MLHSPKKRICPLLMARIRSNMRRQAAGDNSGSSPSITSNRASAFQSVPLSTARYFLAGAGAGAAAPLPEPRMALKNSDDSSITITSFFFAKLAL